MELFKIKLVPVVKERDWEVRAIKNNRKEKKCEICGHVMEIGHSSTTFTKRTSKGAKTEYETHHTCADNQSYSCVKAMSDKLRIDTDSAWTN